MNCGFENVAVSLASNVLTVSGTLLNQSSDTWNAQDGWALGFHLFDDPTSTLVVDGERQPLDTAPEAKHSFSFRIETPAEPGEYSTWVSVMREHVAWFYEQGWPFVLIDFTVDDNGLAKLRRWRVADSGSVAAARIVRGFVRAITIPAASLWRNRSLIRTLVRRDILGRYRGSFAGAFWAILNPLLLMVTYFFVFGVVLRTRLANDPSRASWALYFLAGMLPWLAFSEAIGRSPTVMVEHRNFIRKLVFPVETLPVNLVATGLVTELFGVILFLIALLLLRHQIPATALWLPLLVIPQILFTAGVSWFLSALGVFVRDLAQINGFLLTLWFFITPICYPEASLPGQAVSVLSKNPMFVLVRAYRAVLLEHSAPDLQALAWVTAVALLVFLAGHAWFYKLRRSFADLI